MKKDRFLGLSLLAIAFFLSACSAPQAVPSSVSQQVPQGDGGMAKNEYDKIAEEKLQGINLKPDECYWFEYEGKYFCAEGTMYPLENHSDIAQYYPGVQVPEQIQEIPFQSIMFSAENHPIINSAEVLPQGVVLGEIQPMELKEGSLAGITVQYGSAFTVVAFKKGIQTQLLLSVKEETELADGIKVITNDGQQTMLNWNADGYNFFLLANQGTKDEKAGACEALYDAGILEQFAMQASI